MSWFWSSKSATADPKYTNVLAIVAYTKDVETSNSIGYDVYKVESKDPRELAKFVTALTFKEVPLPDDAVVISGELENTVVDELRKYLPTTRIERKEGLTYIRFSA